MTASTAEHATDSGKSEGGVENHSALRQPQSSAEAAADLSDTFLRSLPLQNSEFQTAKLLGNGALVQAANRPVRFAAVQRAQRSHGNRFVQNVTRRLQRHSNGRQTVQRTESANSRCPCGGACGGTCAECKALASSEPETKAAVLQPRKSVV